MQKTGTYEDGGSAKSGLLKALNGHRDFHQNIIGLEKAVVEPPKRSIFTFN
jgi:hypothetical protein